MAMRFMGFAGSLRQGSYNRAALRLADMSRHGTDWKSTTSLNDGSHLLQPLGGYHGPIQNRFHTGVKSFLPALGRRTKIEANSDQPTLVHGGGNKRCKKGMRGERTRL